MAGRIERLGGYAASLTTPPHALAELIVVVALMFWVARAIPRRERGRERAIRERERFFTLSLEPLCIAGTGGYFKRLSPTFERTPGYPLVERLLRPLLDFIHPNDCESKLAEIARHRAGLVDLAVLAALVGDDPAVIAEFVHDFRCSATQIGIDLQGPWPEHALRQAAALAHKLKFSALSIGARELAELCARAEAAVAREDSAALPALIEAFERAMADVLDERASARALNATEPR